MWITSGAIHEAKKRCATQIITCSFPFQSAGCKAQKKSVIGAHNRCWKYLLGAISKHGEAKRDVEFIGEDKDRQLESLWRETRIGDVLPWEDVADEAQRLLGIHKAS